MALEYPPESRPLAPKGNNRLCMVEGERPNPSNIKLPKAVAIALPLATGFAQRSLSVRFLTFGVVPLY